MRLNKYRFYGFLCMNIVRISLHCVTSQLIFLQRIKFVTEPEIASTKISHYFLSRILHKKTRRSKIKYRKSLPQNEGFTVRDKIDRRNQKVRRFTECDTELSLRSMSPWPEVPVPSSFSATATVQLLQIKPGNGAVATLNI